MTNRLRTKREKSRPLLITTGNLLLYRVQILKTLKLSPESNSVTKKNMMEDETQVSQSEQIQMRQSKAQKSMSPSIQIRRLWPNFPSTWIKSMRSKVREEILQCLKTALQEERRMKVWRSQLDKKSLQISTKKTWRDLAHLCSTVKDLKSRDWIRVTVLLLRILLQEPHQ